MQELIDIPDYLEALHRESQEVAARILAAVAPLGRRDLIDARVDLLALAPPAVRFLHDGFLKYLHDGKIVRIYLGGDLIIPQTDRPSGGTTLTSDFATEATSIPLPEFRRALATAPTLLEEYERFLALDHRILHVLCALHMASPAKPRVVVRHFKPGETIIRQGDRPDAIYLLIEGEAAAMIDGGIEVGRIAPGEIFGEISFLTDHARIADVVARERCLVQAIDEEEFLRLIRVKPQLAVDVARTLARRVMALNTRVAAHEVT